MNEKGCTKIVRYTALADDFHLIKQALGLRNSVFNFPKCLALKLLISTDPLFQLSFMKLSVFIHVQFLYLLHYFLCQEVCVDKPLRDVQFCVQMQWIWNAERQMWNQT